jgi:hypothetical protein
VTDVLRAKLIKLEEMTPGDGHACWSMFLNGMFKKRLPDSFGTDNGWDEDTLEDAIRRFEDHTKREFDEDTTEVSLSPSPQR